MVMTYTEELTAANPRHAAQIVVKTGVKKDGRITARQIKVYWNGGAYGAMKPIPNGQLARRGQGRRRVRHSERAHRFLRDLYQQRSLRPLSLARVGAAGLCQRIANRHDRCRDENRPARAAPAQRADGWFPTPDVKGMVDVKCKEVLEAARGRRTGKKKLPAHVGRGMALSYRHVGLGEANARIRLNPDGKVSILTTYADTGTGAHTILCQMVAEVLDVPLDQVGLEVGTTDAFRSESGTGCKPRDVRAWPGGVESHAQLKSLLCERAAGNAWRVQRQNHCKERPPQRGSSRRAFPRLPTGRSGSGRKISARKPRAITLNTKLRPKVCFAACVAEVAVDVSTGQLTVRQLDTIHDVATILNPVGHQGQIDGGIMQGVGYGLMEELVMEEGGRNRQSWRIQGS
jgi:xanthine dehydrogenase molybdenum-binding subunit